MSTYLIQWKMQQKSRLHAWIGPKQANFRCECAPTVERYRQAKLPFPSSELLTTFLRMGCHVFKCLAAAQIHCRCIAATLSFSLSFYLCAWVCVCVGMCTVLYYSEDKDLSQQPLECVWHWRKYNVTLNQQPLRSLSLSHCGLWASARACVCVWMCTWMYVFHLIWQCYLRILHSPLCVWLFSRRPEWQASGVCL